MATVLCATGAREPAANFHPGTLKGPAKGTPNQVMVLGTAHLRYLPGSFRPASLKPLTDRLAAWKPTIIAIEERSGPQRDFMRQYPQRYKETVRSYCGWDPAPARTATGLAVPVATAGIDRLLASWPAVPTPAQRRHLAAMFLAGGEPVSALVQWLREPRLGDSEGVMALYWALDAPAQAGLIYASDFGAALEEPSPQRFGRGYVEYWETRNLRMASNIRAAIAELPGSRTLVIFGASHKWYLAGYLNQMHDVRTVSPDQVLP